MTEPDRRSFLKMLGASAAGAALRESIGRAAAMPANNATRSIKDVEHIVILMQENRSFDHYFGTLSGVRGFGDPRVALQPNGRPVWDQQNAAASLLPFRPDLANLGLQFIADTPHDWNSTHLAWNQGHWDQWIAHKTTTTMTHFSRDDIPFHYALADAFTICDAYHCSVLGPTYPNRDYMFTGWAGNDGRGGGPQLETDGSVLDWPTYPERLQAAGISWRVYQDTGSGLTAANNWGNDPDHYVGNSANNQLLRFVRYQTAPDSDPLAQRARTGTNIAVSGTLFDELARDVANGTLPQVSWLMCPNAYDEHPNWPANYGAWFVSRVIDTLTSNPEIWSRTAFFLTYDENDGFFDHIVPPMPPHCAAAGQSTVSIDNEIFAGTATHQPGPFGLGPRVPMLVISPWSRGGWVNSQVFDHTSLIRFIEARFADGNPGLIEPQISPWRRAVVGDLTSAFDFRTPNAALPALPSTATYAPPDRTTHRNVSFPLPSSQQLPSQEPGIRRARPLPYDLHVEAAPVRPDGSLVLALHNHGRATGVLQVRDHTGAAIPRSFTIEPGKSLQDLRQASTGYDLGIHGPNGFYRSFRGGGTPTSARIGIATRTDPGGGLTLLTLLNGSLGPVHADIHDHYRGETFRVLLPPRLALPLPVLVGETFGWYDLTITTPEDDAFAIRMAGHIEDGRATITDPAIGLPGTNVAERLKAYSGH